MAVPGLNFLDGQRLEEDLIQLRTRLLEPTRLALPGCRGQGHEACVGLARLAQNDFLARVGLIE